MYSFNEQSVTRYPAIAVTAAYPAEFETVGEECYGQSLSRFERQ